ncbi:uncharacterized protein LOC107982232 [Nasonia vitripennis]|uniref:Vitellogenin domain-containing protein n=1 Tax=Nasonia vitripennis TaxID=7425 RepID=A0A7M7IYM4_NASVI|nr:uncharacterized protein LOC107982232 [Nasonia vitripennis]
MVRFTHLYVSGILMCLLSIHNVTSDSETFKYELNSIHYVHLDPHLAKTILRINSDIYLKPNKNLKNSYFASLRNTELSIEKANGTFLNLKKCLNMVLPSLSLLRPFVVVYDEDGLLKHITVHRTEADLSVNLKLLLSNLLQVNKTALVGANAAQAIKEPIYVGDCPANYTIQRESQSKLEIFWVEKKYDMKLCSDLKSNNSSGISSLLNNCRNDTQKHLKWDRKIDMILTAKKKAATCIEYVTMTENIQYLPWANSSKEIFLETLTTIALVTDKTSIIPPYFFNINSVNVSRLWYREIDQSIIKGETKNKDLSETYKALACDSTNQNLFMEFYEKAINCWKIF